MVSLVFVKNTNSHFPIVRCCRLVYEKYLFLYLGSLFFTFFYSATVRGFAKLQKEVKPVGSKRWMRPG